MPNIIKATSFIFLLIFFAMGVSTQVRAEEATAIPPTHAELATSCYGYAEMGKDHVINKNLDLPLEVALRSIVDHFTVKPDGTMVPMFDMLHYKIVTGAYEWEGTPEEYRDLIMDACMGDYSGLLDGGE